MCQTLGDVMAESKDEALSSWNLQSSPSTSPRPAPTFTSLVSPTPSCSTWLHIDPASLWLTLGVGSSYHCGLRSQLASVQNLAPLLTSYMTLGKLLPLSELQFPRTKNEGYDRSFFSGSEKNETSVHRGHDSVWNIIGLDFLAYYCS